MEKVTLFYVPAQLIINDHRIIIVLKQNNNIFDIFIHMNRIMIHEKTIFLHMQKTKAQISCAVTAQLISAFVFAI